MSLYRLPLVALFPFTVLTSCSKAPKSDSELAENIERTVGQPQESQGIFGGNSGPADAGDSPDDEAQARGVDASSSLDAGS